MAEKDASFAPGFRELPYWWDAATPPDLPQPAEDRTPDVAIIGSGFTGLAAALFLLRGGRSVTIFDAEEAGYGASRRNAGYLGRTLKRSVGWLKEHHGESYALSIYNELNDAYALVRQLIADEGIQCGLKICGRFIGATSPAHYEILARELAEAKAMVGYDYHMVSRAEQHREVASDAYYGGAMIPDLGALHPGLYHDGLLRSVLAAGGKVRSKSPVTAIEPAAAAGRHRVVSPRGEVAARDVIIATNGYTPGAFAWHARRVIPFTAYMAATEPLAPGKLASLLPQGRTCLDTNMNINFYRPSPDGSRLLFGGKTGSRMSSIRAMAGDLTRILRRLLPDIGEVRLSHAWTGKCAGTFDFMPHMGTAGGIHYAMGYNFAGVPMGTYLGRKLALKILGSPDAKTAFEIRPFPSFPLYGGNPWFVPAAMRYFDWHDRRIARRAA